MSASRLAGLLLNNGIYFLIFTLFQPVTDRGPKAREAALGLERANNFLISKLKKLAVQSETSR